MTNNKHTKTNIQQGTTVPLYHKALLSVNEAAEYTGIGKNSIAKLVDDPNTGIGRFVGKKRMIHRDSLDRYLQENRRLI